MKKDKILTTILFIVVILLINGSCKKENDTELKDEEISTEVSIPVLSTNEVSAISKTTVTSGGNITSDGGATISERGVCWSTNQTPTITDSKTSDGTGVGSFESSITGLTSNTTYYIRAYATNSKGTGYGVAKTFKTLDGGNSNDSTLTDIEGFSYKIVKIGNQIWMAENLKTTKYHNGNVIPNITNDTEWSELRTGALCDYKNTPSYSEIYGRIYNWYAVETGILCPTGWHIPTDSDWSKLINYIGGQYDAGGKLKETGTTHWASPNEGATNEIGFTALPSGTRDYYAGEFSENSNFSGYWWSSSEYDSIYAYLRYVDCGFSDMLRNTIRKGEGLSVRCIKD